MTEYVKGYVMLTVQGVWYVQPVFELEIRGFHTVFDRAESACKGQARSCTWVALALHAPQPSCPVLSCTCCANLCNIQHRSLAGCLGKGSLASIGSHCGNANPALAPRLYEASKAPLSGRRSTNIERKRYCTPTEQ